MEKLLQPGTQRAFRHGKVEKDFLDTDATDGLFLDCCYDVSTDCKCGLFGTSWDVLGHCVKMPRLKADLGARLPSTGQTALHLAAALGDLGVLRVLKVRQLTLCNGRERTREDTRGMY